MTNLYFIFSIVLTLAILLAYLNHRFIQIPTTIAIMTGALLIALGLLISDGLDYHYLQKVKQLILHIHFQHLLMDGMLAFLLFAGALSVDLHYLNDQKWEILVLATVSTIASAILVGVVLQYSLSVVNIRLPPLYCFLFGALISPTDPIAVLTIFKYLQAPKSLSIKVEAESLFNDGVGIVLFITFYQIKLHGYPVNWINIGHLFVKQALGGIVYGFMLGLLTDWLMKPLQDMQMKILITLAAAAGGYTVAQLLHLSGPLAMVTAGILIGNREKIPLLKSDHQQDSANLMAFWSIIDEILNAVLFLLLGFELLIIDWGPKEFVAAGVSIPLVLAIRYLVVGIPMNLFKLWRTYVPHSINIMTWGGLRGGLAVALVLTLPDSPYRHILLVMTYSVVLFSLIIQGLTIKPLIQLSIKKLKIHHKSNGC